MARTSGDDVPLNHAWSAHQLAEFLASIGDAPTERAALQNAIERTAEALDAEIAAIVRGDKVLVSVGFPRGVQPGAYLRRITEQRVAEIDLPELGTFQAAAVRLDDPTLGHLVLCRRGELPFESNQMSVLHGMARVLVMTVRLLRLVEAEREAREESDQRARDNQRLVETLRQRHELLESIGAIQRSISRRRPLQETLDETVNAAARMFGDDNVIGLRLVDVDDPGRMTIVSSSNIHEETLARIRRTPVTSGLGGRAIAENRVVVTDDYRELSGAVGEFVAEGVLAAMAAPVHHMGAVIGSLTVASITGRRYGQDATRTLQTLAEHASLALTDAKTVEAMSQALRDPLTGLANRALLIDRLSHTLLRRGTRADSVGLAFLDLDRFKTVNDSLGHHVGDDLLVGVAARLLECIRPEDTIARLGGDEFVVLVEQLTSVDDMTALASRIIEALEPAFHVAGRDLYISTSIGIAIGTPLLDTAAEMLREADLAMYAAKERGRANYTIYHPELNARAVRRLEAETAFRRALDDGELLLVYQPIVSLKTGALTSIEALVRWQNGAQIVSPGEFIPHAEESGLIVPMGYWVLEHACREATCWQGGTHAPGLNVNLSARQFVQPDLVDRVRRILANTGLAPGRLTLEITESVLMHDVATVAERLHALKDLGVQLAVDDFGTGYSSLNYLRQFPVDTLKIDRAFIDPVGAGADDEAGTFARAIVRLAHTLGKETVAEGIESSDQLEQLQNLGCDLGQGYFFARPASPDVLGELIRDWDRSVVVRRAPEPSPV